MPSALTLAFCIAWSICFSLPRECRYRHICSIRSLSLYHLPVVGEFSFPTFDAERPSSGHILSFGIYSSAKVQQLFPGVAAEFQTCDSADAFDGCVVHQC